MANDYFRFKQFTINQGNSAMKVCTDSCLFGAYINPVGAKTILDIGAGTGLLSLMMAQQTNGQASIHAVELDPGAAQQARENVAASPWATSIQVVESSIQAYVAASTRRFDLIISNPPFFAKQLKRQTQAQNLAMHSDALSLEELISCVQVLLAEEGKFAVLLPPQEAELLQALAHEKGLFANHKVLVYAVDGGRHLRTIIVFSRKEAPASEVTISIKDQAGEYTSSFVALLKEYYLHL